MDIAINAGGVTANITITETLTASQIEELIHTLAETRQQMTPPVAPTLADQPGTQCVSVIDNPAMTIKPLHSGGVRIYARSSGLGWLRLDINQQDWNTLVVLYSRIHGNADAAANLINAKPNGRH